jgi:hypothetical protein
MNADNQPAVAGQVEPTVRRTMAEVLQPTEGSMVEFWCHRMSQQGQAGTGIRGWFRGGLFWSYDDADHYAPGEVTYWTCLRNALQCAARGCDGCRVCAPNTGDNPRA